MKNIQGRPNFYLELFGSTSWVRLSGYDQLFFHLVSCVGKQVPKNNSIRNFAHEGYWPVVVSTRRNCNMLSPPGFIMGVLNRIGEGRLGGELLPCNVRGWGSTAAPK